jgi:hypothetical protein
MPINVTCPHCHSRFNVSDKFAGQTGPCPKCKNPISVPKKSEEVVIHSPDEFGPKDASGRGVLKPLEREETGVSAVVIAAVVAGCVGALVVTYLLGRAYQGSETGVPLPILALGAVLFGPPVAFAGYGLLRNHELEPHRGTALILRSLVCGLIYASLWGVYWYVKSSMLGGAVEIFHLAFIIPALVAAGAVTALASLELDFGTGAMHYGLYLLVTVTLRLVLSLPPY